MVSLEQGFNLFKILHGSSVQCQDGKGVGVGWGGEVESGEEAEPEKAEAQEVVKLTEHCQFYTLVHLNPCSNSLEDGMTSFSLQMERTSFFVQIGKQGTERYQNP